MATHIALIRGINVGGRHALPMKALTALLEDLGAETVTTYIQSGNVVFRHTRRGAARLAGEIETAIEAAHGFRPRVLLLKPAELDAAIAANPFPEATSAPKTLHATFLSSAAKRPDLASLEAMKAPTERFALVGRVFYLHAPEGIGRSKIATRAEKALGVPCTTRNWRTVLKLKAMVEQVSR